MYVLIVDDAADLCLILTVFLEDAGYRVASAEHGQAALAYLAAATTLPCLILLDLMMPIMNGHEFRARQLADPVLAAIPVVVLTAVPPGAAAAAALQAVAVLKKPLDFAAILALVAQYCTAS
jgi:CheY-like chemotaxis protein